VRLKGKRIRTGVIEVRYLASLLRHARVGVIVPKHSHSSVERNLVKRRLRELVRRELLPFLPSLDVVVRAAPSAYGASFDRLRDATRRVRETLEVRETS